MGGDHTEPAKHFPVSCSEFVVALLVVMKGYCFRSGILTEIDYVPTIIGGVKGQFDLVAGRVS